VEEISELDTYTQPDPATKHAPPSGASCQVYPATACRERAMIRLVKPLGS
jgi:hypothetical protein